MARITEEFASEVAALRKAFGLRLIKEEYDQKAFGNCAVELSGTDFDMRLVRDRGQMSIDLRGESTNGEWMWVESALKQAGVQNVEESKTFHQMLDLLLVSRESVVQYFARRHRNGLWSLLDLIKGKGRA